MKARRFAGFVGIAVIAGLLLAGCRAEERGRITKYEPGVYKGKKEAALSKKMLSALRYRARFQSGTVTPGGGGKTSASKSNVRLPSAVSTGTRARKQKGP